MISRLPQGFSTRCLRFARDVAAARARLASGWLVGLCRERVELSGSRRKVSERSHVVLLSRAYPVASWAHARRKFFEIAELKKAPIAIEAVRRIDALFAIERKINGMTAEGRRTVRAARARPLVTALEAWLREHRAKLSAKSEMAKAIDYCSSAGRHSRAFLRTVASGCPTMRRNGRSGALPSEGGIGRSPARTRVGGGQRRSTR